MITRSISFFGKLHCVAQFHFASGLMPSVWLTTMPLIEVLTKICRVCAVSSAAHTAIKATCPMPLSARIGMASGVAMRRRKNACAAINMANSAPLSPDSEMDMPIARPARMVLITA